MAVIIQTGQTDLDTLPRLDPADNQRGWAYNAMDAIVTRAVADRLLPVVNEKAGTSYRFVRAMQGPALDMMRRGIAVNPLHRMRETKRLEGEREGLLRKLNILANAVWGMDLNPDSPKQVQAFFYGALKLPVKYAIRKTPQGHVRTPSCDHKALEELAKIETKGPAINPYDRNYVKVKLAQPIVSLITSIRDTGKKLNVVRSALSADGRLRCSYNVVGTVTGRWSSSSNAFNEGTNLQNITEYMRRMCCADDGWKIAGPDLEQAESRLVAALVWMVTGDDTYWRACNSADLHTSVAMMSYPELPWPGELDPTTFTISNAKACKEFADKSRSWYRHLSYRDGAKRIGHGSNYWGTAYGIAMSIGITRDVVDGFQRRYFTAFPAIPKWHRWTIAQVQTKQKLETPLGRVRHFFGRVYDDSTLREAIAHVPQSTIGEMLNEGLRRVWAYSLDNRDFRAQVQLLLQVHDSINFQYPETSDEAAILAKIRELMTVAIPIHRINEQGLRTGETRILTIPLEFKTGWNWAKRDPKCDLFADGNPDGLDKYNGNDGRRRTEPAKPSLDQWLD